MQLYKALSKITLTGKKYSAKFLLIAIVGIYIPVILVVLYAAVHMHLPFYGMFGLIVILAFIMVGVNLLLMNKLADPLILAKKSLDNYLVLGNIPDLPVHHKDEAGQLMASVQATIEKLDELLSEKSDMIDMLSHDLRSPIARIITLSNLIDMDEATDPGVYTARIVAESQSLLALLEDILLILKKADGNKIKFHLVSARLKDVVVKAIGFYEFAAKEKNIKWHVNIEQRLTAYIEPVMFAQVIKNIVGNALKFSDRDKNIYIASAVENQQIILTIKDEGIGFVPEDKEKIFERFTRSGVKGVMGEPSTGLGLSLAKKIIEKHDGQLLASSEGLNKGALFTIILPRKSRPFKIIRKAQLMNKFYFKRAMNY